jgi:hypothetical protein
MKRIWIILLAIAVALAIALPAGAKKPEKPPKPDGGFRPIACQLGGEEDVFLRSGTYKVTPLREFVFGLYTVDPGTSEGVLCAEVSVTSGTLSDLRVRWLDYVTNVEGGCELAWARGKELSKINNGEVVFGVGLSLENWSDEGGLCGAVNDNDGGNMTVVVMPVAKITDTWVEVTIGIDSGR